MTIQMTKIEDAISWYQLETVDDTKHKGKNANDE